MTSPYVTLRAFLFAALMTVSWAAPRNASCVPTSCFGDQCPKVSCNHGKCEDDGLCVCDPCWNGPNCDQFSNVHHPQFVQKHMAKFVNSSTPVGSEIFEIEAQDQDLKDTCNLKPCDCSKVTFEIDSGNSDGIFSLDPNTGKLTLVTPLSNVMDGRTYVLQVSVGNQIVEGEGGDVVGPREFGSLRITVGDGFESSEYDMNQNEAVLERYRRQAPIPTSVSNITFTLTKTGSYNYTTTMMVGSKVHFQLQIQFPPSQTIDLLVELFTPENTSTIMILCNPVIVYSGSNLAYNTTAAKPVQDANDGSLNYDRAVLNFGNVANSGAGSGSASVIQIEWDVVMIDSDNTINGSYYWVSAGAEYNQQNEIWVGQAGFIAIIDNFNTSTSNPQFNMTGPSDVPIGSSAVFRVDMYIPYPSIEMNFDVFAPFNFTDAASVCTIMVVGVGANYECYQYLNLPYTSYPSSTGLTKDRGTLALGRVVNKGSREPTVNWTDNRISIEYVIFIPYNESIIGQTLWIGSTLELGTDQIWAGQISFNAIAAVSAAPLSSPAATLFYPIDQSPSTILSYSKGMSLNVSIPINTASNYSLAFNADGVKCKLCSAKVNFVGDNIPCNGPNDPVYSTTSTTVDLNRIDWALATLENKNQRSTAIDPYANIFQVYVYVLPLSYPGMAINDQCTVSGTVTGSNSQVSSFNYNLVLSNITETPSVTAATRPSVNISYSFGSTSVNVNQTVDIRFKIAFTPGVLNSPVTLNFTAPTVSGKNQFTIIRAEIMSIGNNFPCSYRYKLNNSVQYTALPTDDKTYMAVLNLGPVQNVANPPAVGMSFYPTVDDMIEIRAVVLINNITPLPPNGLFKSIFSFSPSISYNDTETITVGTVQQMNYNTNSTPFIGYDYKSAEGSSIPAGYQFRTEMVIKTAPKSVADWMIIADVSHDPDLSICSVYVKEHGYDLPFVNLSTPARKTASANPLVYSKGWIELYKLTNIGTKPMNSTFIFDDGSFVVGVVVQVSSSAAVNTPRHVTISADYGMNGIDSTDAVNFTVASVPPSLTYNAASTQPNISFAQTKVNENSTALTTNVYKGQTLILTTEFSYPYVDASNSLKVKIQAPSDDSVEVVEFNVVFVGQNFPCLQKRTSIRTLSKSGSNIHNNVAEIDLGIICTVPIDKKYNPNNNKIRLEAIATIVRDSAAAVGSTITISSITTMNSTALPSNNLVLTLIASPPTDKDFNYVGPNAAYVYTSQDPVTMTSFSNHLFNSSITILPNTSDVATVDIALSMDTTSAVMTAVYFRLVSFGVNLGSVTIPFPTTTVYTSTKLTTQNDKASISLGRITNTGHTYRAGINAPGDDDIVIEVLVQMADAKNAVQGTAWTITYKFTYLGISPTNVSSVVASKPTTDDISLNVTPYVDSLSHYSGGDTIPMSFNIYHNAVSRAEPFNVNFLFYFPNFFDFNPATFSHNFIDPIAPTPTFTAGKKFFYVNFGHVYFTDNITINFNVSVIANMLASNAANELVRLAYEIEMDVNPKSTPTTPGTFLATPMQFINLTVNTIPIQYCASEVSLGMSSSIQDCQISGSPGENAYSACRPSGAGWKPSLRAGNFERYLQIFFADATMVTKVILTQTSTDKIKNFNLMYSNDGFNWQNGDALVAPVTTSPTTFPIPKPVVSSYFKILIVDTYTAKAMPAFTVDFQGCIVTPSALTGAARCLTRNGWQAPTSVMGDFAMRGLGLVGPNGFFCDTMPNMLNMKCFSSPDGVVWQAIDKTVVNILGYMTTTNRLYGLDKNKRAVVMSEDNGNTWVSVSESFYNSDKVKLPSFVPGKSVPWNTQIDGTPVVQGSFSAKFDGLYYNSAKVADWMECCS